MIVTVRDYAETMRGVAVDKAEVARYCSDKGDGGFLAVIDECVAEALPLVSYRVCFSELPVSVCDGRVTFPFAPVESKALAKNLKKCDKAVVFCATAGIGIDRLIAKYADISPVKALAFQGIGAERIEALCEVFCDDIKKDYKVIRPRFSPGYGDLGLDFQTGIFSALQCGKRIGVTLSDSLLMSPTKSVTAIIGVEK